MLQSEFSQSSEKCDAETAIVPSIHVGYAATGYYIL